MLISSLESILFAINIDTVNLNIPSKLAKSHTVSQIHHNDSLFMTMNQQMASSLPNNYGEYEKDASTLADATRAITLKSKKHKKNTNVIIFDNEGTQAESISPKVASPNILSTNNSSSKNIVWF